MGFGNWNFFSFFFGCGDEGEMFNLIFFSSYYLIFFLLLILFYLVRRLCVF